MLREVENLNYYLFSDIRSETIDVYFSGSESAKKIEPKVPKANFAHRKKNIPNEKKAVTENSQNGRLIVNRISERPLSIYLVGVDKTERLISQHRRKTYLTWPQGSFWTLVADEKIVSLLGICLGREFALCVH